MAKKKGVSTSSKAKKDPNGKPNKNKYAKITKQKKTIYTKKQKSKQKALDSTNKTSFDDDDSAKILGLDDDHKKRFSLKKLFRRQQTSTSKGNDKNGFDKEIIKEDVKSDKSQEDGSLDKTTGNKDNKTNSETSEERLERIKQKVAEKLMDDSKSVESLYLPSDVVDDKVKILDEYKFVANNIPVTIKIYKTLKEFVPVYEVSISSITRTTEIILEKIRRELINQVNLGIAEITDIKKSSLIDDKLKEVINLLVIKYFPDADDESRSFLSSYLIQKSLGMGNVEILVADDRLEEIAINGAHDPVWVYHKKHGWLKTNIQISSEDQTRHFATMIGRKVGRQISSLEPLLDAHLNEGDRVNATLMPISTMGNTITLRKFSRDPFTVTKFLESKTMSYDAAALIWLGMQYELSALVAGGTASGKTSTLNVIASFLPPNQRIISIEDTRELRLPKFLHWVPLSTRTANAEGKGSISMEDLLVNSLRMRPDRILVGEVRRKAEAETLFEAIHTGHSCYATFHANDANETVGRLTNPPIDVPKTMLPAISMIIMQFRNRRTGFRRTFQIAEILPDATPNVLQQYDPKKDVLVQKNKSRSLMATLELFTGHSAKEIKSILDKKVMVLKYLVKNKITSVDGVGRVMAEYYTNYDQLMKFVKSGKNMFKDKTSVLKSVPKGKSVLKKPKLTNKKIQSKLKLSKAKVSVHGTRSASVKSSGKSKRYKILKKTARKSGKAHKPKKQTSKKQKKTSPKRSKKKK